VGVYRNVKSQDDFNLLICCKQLVATLQAYCNIVAQHIVLMLNLVSANLFIRQFVPKTHCF